MERLVDAVTARILSRLRQPPEPPAASAAKQRLLVLGKDSACPIRDCLNREFEAELRPDLDDANRFDFVVLPSSYLARLRGGAPAARETERRDNAMECRDNIVDCRSQRLLHERELREKYHTAAKTVRVGKHTMITPLAADFLKSRGLAVVRED